MDWMDFDRNGVVDGIDFFILNEIINSPKPKEENTLFLDKDYDDEDNLSW